MRSYLPDDHPDKAREIGAERSVAEYVATLVDVFRTVRRVLRPDGTLWLNLGDSYNGNRGGSPGLEKTHPEARPAVPRGHGVSETSLPAKALLGVPWRVAFALQDDGWLLRLDIIWEKTNARPESVEDRPSGVHEYLFLFAQGPRYYYDRTAIAEPADASDGTRNKRSVWHVATAGTDEAHFAVMPPALVTPCVLASTSAHGVCAACSAPWRRVVERGALAGEGALQATARPAAAERGVSQSSLLRSNGRTYRERVERGWAPTCACGTEEVRPAVVLDPFGGSGTTGRVAQGLGRDAIVVELFAEYQRLAQMRSGPLFATVDAREGEV